jgi:hypothetical protein
MAGFKIERQATTSNSIDGDGEFEIQTCCMIDVRAHRAVVHAIAMLSDETEG